MQRRGQVLAHLARQFAFLGATSIGGPAAHIAMMRRRFVERDGELTDDEFGRLVGACSLVPGPNSTELAMALGARRGGAPGLLVSGISFVLPAAVIVALVAAAYERAVTSDVIDVARRWLVPVVAALIVRALVSLRTVAVANPRDLGVALYAIAASALGVPELLVIAVAGVIVAVLSRPTGGAAVLVPLWAPWSPSLVNVFLVFLKLGSVIYGSGYVLLAFLETDVVGRGWVSERVLVDAVAVGQITPGPVFTTATFIGWQLRGAWGAVAATAGIFLPSFVFAGLIPRIVALADRRPVVHDFLRGVTTASLAVMVVVLWRLGDTTLRAPQSVAVFVATGAFLLWRERRRE